MGFPSPPRQPTFPKPSFSALWRQATTHTWRNATEILDKPFEMIRVCECNYFILWNRAALPKTARDSTLYQATRDKWARCVTNMHPSNYFIFWNTPSLKKKTIRPLASHTWHNGSKPLFHNKARSNKQTQDKHQDVTPKPVQKCT